MSHSVFWNGHKIGDIAAVTTPATRASTGTPPDPTQAALDHWKKEIRKAFKEDLGGPQPQAEPAPEPTPELKKYTYDLRKSWEDDPVWKFPPSQAIQFEEVKEEATMPPELLPLSTALEDIKEPIIHSQGHAYGLSFDGPNLYYDGDDYGTEGPPFLAGSFETEYRFWAEQPSLSVTTQNNFGTRTCFKAVMVEVRELTVPPGYPRRYEVEYESRGAVEVTLPDGHTITFD